MVAGAGDLGLRRGICMRRGPSEATLRQRSLREKHVSI